MDDRPLHLDLFSGIGGFTIAAGWAGYRTIGFSETDPFCCRLLEERFPGIPNYGDIRNVTKQSVFTYTNSWGCVESIDSSKCEAGVEQKQSSRDNSHGNSSDGNGRSAVDLLTGGFPCQPYSVAGKRRGSEDDRHLWPEMLRIISEIRPNWVVGENVAGIIPMELDTVLSGLEGSAYETQAFIIPACGVDALHRRDRVWIVAHSESDGREQTLLRRQIASGIGLSGEDVADSPITRLEGTAGTGIQRGIGRPAGFSAWLAESRMGRMADGVCSWMDESDIPRVATGVKDRAARLKALGNSIVPQVAYEILRSIMEIDG